MKRSNQNLPIDPAVEHRRQAGRERYARKRVEFLERRKLRGLWAGFNSDAIKAIQEIERCDRKLAALGALLLTMVSALGQGVPVVSDTNQLKLIPSGVKVEWRTNLYEVVTHTFVTTNWMPVGPPVDIKTNGVVVARRQHERATLLTNVFHTLTHEGIERRFMVSQTIGPELATRYHDFPPPMDTPTFLAVPLRQQR